MQFWSEGRVDDAGGIGPWSIVWSHQETAVNTIDALADAYGIESQYVDAHGITRNVTAGTKRSLLRALGANVRDERDAQSALDELVRRAWQRALPPVIVSASADVTIPITCPADTAVVCWNLALEDGSERSGAAEFSALAVIEERFVDERKFQRRQLAIPDIPLGYHELAIAGSDRGMTLIVTPQACVLPESIVQKHGWGVAVQLYAVRSDSNWGIGDFSDLKRMTGVFCRPRCRCSRPQSAACDVP